MISINSISTTADTTTTITEQALDILRASDDTAAASAVSVHALTVAPSAAHAPDVHHATHSAPAAHRHYEALSRGLNFLLAAVILVVLSPLWLLIALAIKLSSPGPVFYTRTVIGRDGTPFTYYKFRTMRVNNDDSAHRAFLEQYVKENKPFTVERDAVTGEERPVFKVVGDPRVTANLGRPTVDTINGSAHNNMKELRASKGGALRVLFIFDPIRRAVLLLGGNKTGQWEQWYSQAIPVADALYDEYLADIRKEGLIP